MGETESIHQRDYTMTTTMRNCLPLARQLHPCHTIMAYREATQPVIEINIIHSEVLPAYLVHTQTGVFKSEQFNLKLAGPTTVYLVASKFTNLYYIIQSGRCTCPKGRVDPTCKHLEIVAQMQATPDDDLAAHVDDDLFTNAIRGDRIVRVLKADLTRAEKRAIYVASFNPCGGAA